MTTRTARLVEYRDIAPKVRHFCFEVPGVERLQFAPGQFISFTDRVGDRQVTRAYSICSAPDGNRFELCLNRVDHGSFSPPLFGLEPGNSIPMQGPLGCFTLREPASDSVLVATGTGIAPFRGMLLDPDTIASGRQFTLIFGVRHEHGLLYRREFEDLASRSPNFRFVPVLSRPGPDWKGATGHVQPHLLAAVGERRDMDVYICGLQAMVNDVRHILNEAGFDHRRLIYEKFD